jgi:hypothetical protein
MMPLCNLSPTVFLPVQGSDMKKKFPLAGWDYICPNEKPTLYLLTTESQLVTHNRKLQQDKPYFRFDRPSLWSLCVTNFCLFHCVTNKVTYCSVIWPETKTIFVTCTRDIWITWGPQYTYSWWRHSLKLTLNKISITCWIPTYLYWIYFGTVSDTWSFLSVTYSVTTCTMLQLVIKQVCLWCKRSKIV